MDELQSRMERCSTQNHRNTLGSYVPPGLGPRGSLSQGSAPLHPGLFSCVPSGNFTALSSRLDSHTPMFTGDPSLRFAPVGMTVLRVVDRSLRRRHPGNALQVGREFDAVKAVGGEQALDGCGLGESDFEREETAGDERRIAAGMRRR